ncbi:MAG: RNA-binding S4 domain-containing protein [Bacteroidales bacterium]|nr:RNA-binding S4 domain-containing protein [Bacteroidales bacterium]
MAAAERIDKYLWAIRVFKTRTEATEACKGGKVKVAGSNVKPSRDVKVGETIEVRKGAVVYTYRVKALVDKRVGAKFVPDLAENLTPQSELDKLKSPVETFFLKRDRGTGRPTKKDRRSMEDAWDQLDYNNVIEEIPDDIIERFGLSDVDL